MSKMSLVKVLLTLTRRPEKNMIFLERSYFCPRPQFLAHSQKYSVSKYHFSHKPKKTTDLFWQWSFRKECCDNCLEIFTQKKESLDL